MQTTDALRMRHFSTAYFKARTVGLRVEFTLVIFPMTFRSNVFGYLKYRTVISSSN
jgi:hypothetical protein